MANWPRFMPVAYNNKCRDITLTEWAACNPVIVVRFVIVIVLALE